MYYAGNNLCLLLLLLNWGAREDRDTILMYTSHLFLRKSPHPLAPLLSGNHLQLVLFWKPILGSQETCLWLFVWLWKSCCPFLALSFLISDLQRMDSKGASSSKTLMMMRMLRAMRWQWLDDSQPCMPAHAWQNWLCVLLATPPHTPGGGYCFVTVRLNKQNLQGVVTKPL